MFKKMFFAAFLAITVLIFSTSTAYAKWPDRPVKVVIGAQTGSSNDMVGRVLAQELSTKFGQPFVPHNISGGGLGAFPMTIKNAKSDGYTIGIGSASNFNFTTLQPNMTFGVDDFTYLCMIFRGDAAFVCAPEAPWKNFREALEWSKANGKPLNYMFQTNLDRAMATVYAKEVGATLNIIPSSGPSSILTSIMGGHADVGYSGGLHFEQGRAGKIKTLTMTGLPSTTYPDAPAATAIFNPGFNSPAHRMVVVPKGFPREVMDVLTSALEEIITSQAFKETVENKLHFIVDYMNPADTEKAIHDEFDSNRKLLELTGK